MKNNKILYLVNDSSFFISHRLPTAVAAISEGYEVHIASRMHNNKKYLEGKGFFCHEINFSRSSINFLIELQLIFKIFIVYFKVKPDLYCHETIKPVLYGTLITKFLPRRAVVNTITGLGYIFISQRKIHIFLQKIILFLYRILFSTKSVFTVFENNDDAKLFESHKIIVRNKNMTIIKGAGVDVENIKPNYIKSKKISIVLASRMLWDKGIGEFVEASRLINKTHDNIRFILVGAEDHGNPMGIPKKVLQQWNDEGLVEWKGYSTEVIKIINNSHIACLPSYREGLPKFLIEAAAAGLPIVTTDVPGCREVVKNDVNGLIVPSKNTNLLSKALLLLIQNEKARLRMGLQSRKFAEQEFSLEIVIRATLDYYYQILERQRK